MHISLDPTVAAQALHHGRLVALPTETVYGLGARADLPHAIARVYAAKGRPADHPLIVHVLDTAGLDAWGIDIRDYGRSLAHEFWPGPLTLVVARSSRAGDFVTGGQDTVALRVPSHPVMREVLRALARITGDPSIGIAAPSANRFGRVSPTTSAHVIDELAAMLGPDDIVLEGGSSAVGVESTIVDCTGPAPVILRPGQVSREGVERVTGLRVGETSVVRAPGTLESHYSPRATVRIVDAASLSDTSDNDVTTGLLALASVPTPKGLVRLSEPMTADDYARVLYSALREADALGLATVLAVEPSSAGVGAAVVDRLRRASAPA
ncbi:MAG: L-threonylcarbamoyladenylate synthase [bacterium]|nr:L-threonylcarbamoyladenylate synthase [bacterium]